MISDSGTFKFTIVDTSSHTSFVLIHKQTRVSKEKSPRLAEIIFHRLLQSLNFYGTMVPSLISVQSPLYFLSRKEYQKVHQRKPENLRMTKYFPIAELSKG